MSDPRNPPRCQSCRTVVAWAVTDEGKRIPLDAQADGRPLWVDDGNLYLASRTAGGTPIVRALRKGVALSDETPRYRTHFATCPKADEHRRARPDRRRPAQASLDDAADYVPDPEKVTDMNAYRARKLAEMRQR